MWIEELENGKFKYIERYRNPLTGKNNKVSVTLDKNSKQAENKARHLLQNKISKKIGLNLRKSLTYGELKIEYLSQWTQTVKNSTIRNNKTYDHHISQILSDDTIIANIKKSDIRDMIMNLSKTRPYSVVDKCIKRISAILNYALSMDYIQSNPANFVKVPKPVETYDNSTKFLDFDEMKELYRLMSTKDKIIRDVILFMFLTGMRFGEVVALTTDKIDFENKTIKINATYDYDGKILSTPKTKQSNRIISVSDNILEIINRFIKRNKMIGLDEHLIFVSKYGNPISISYVNSRLKLYMPEKRLTTHIFRHSHISYLAERNVPIRAIMDRVGHSNIDTTLKIYSHTTKNTIEYINDETKINF